MMTIGISELIKKSKNRKCLYIKIFKTCHKMIHYYDTHFGDGDELTRFCILTNNDLNEYSHRTLTFIEKAKTSKFKLYKRNNFHE